MRLRKSWHNQSLKAARPPWGGWTRSVRVGLSGRLSQLRVAFGLPRSDSLGRLPILTLDEPEGLIAGKIANDLRSSCSWPEDLYRVDPLRRADPNRLHEWIGPKATATVNVSIDGAFAAIPSDHNSNPSYDCRSV